VSALALIVVMAVNLGKSILFTPLDLTAIAIAIVSTLLAIRYQVNTMWLILGGAIFGWIMKFAS
jgi:chromate transporter